MLKSRLSGNFTDHEEEQVLSSLDGVAEQNVLAELYREALRKGQPLWFRVSSGSMSPMLRIGEEVYIVPATADDVQVGEIAAFETEAGLVIHRIVQRLSERGNVQLLEMSDVYLHAGRVKSEAVIGRVVAIGRGERRIDLQRPIAQRCGRVTARARYRLYTVHSRSRLAQVLVRKSARLVARLASWYTRCFCASSQAMATTDAANK